MKGKKNINELRKSSDMDLISQWKERYGGSRQNKENIIMMLQPYQYNDLSEKYGLNMVFKFLGKLWTKVKSLNRKQTVLNNDKSFEELFETPRMSSYLLGLNPDPDNYYGTITNIDPDQTDRFLEKYLKGYKKPSTKKAPEKEKTQEVKDPQRRFILKDLEFFDIDKEYTKNNERMKEFSYTGSNNNVQILGEIYPDRKPKNVFISLFAAQKDESKPRANKGVARLILCKFINHLLRKKLVDETYNIKLEPGLYSDTATVIRHNLQKLRKMYKSMGFKKIGKSLLFQMNIMDFIDWCKSKYSDEFFELNS